jgi:sugar transferase (PEP-CTERM/EpsH1 system associated)
VAEDVGIDRMRIVTISNGVDTSRFHPPDVPSRSRLRESLGFSPDHLVVGFVGRFEPIKDPLNLVQAFVRLMHTRPDCRDRVRLVMVGDGSLRTECIRVLRDAGLYDLAFLPGARNDIPDLLRSFDAFVLPSQGEGMSNTILEAMASGLPVVATDVGGNRELVAERQTGFLVPAADPGALAKALEKYLEPGALASQQGVNARTRIEADFSIDRMVASYTHLYDSLLGATKN